MTVINLPFPLALYAKLLKQKVDLAYFKEFSPSEGRSLQSVLDYEGDDMEDVYDLTFELCRNSYGHLTTVQLKSNGDQIKVNQQNKYGSICDVFCLCFDRVDRFQSIL